MAALKYIALVIAGIALLKTYIFIADRYNIIDKPNSRSSHTQVTVRGGGIIFPIFAFIWFIFNDFQYPLFFAGLLIVSLVSFLDDILQLSSLTRFSVQVISVLLLLAQMNLFLNPVALIVFIVISLVAILNIYNFMDGINGITSLYSLSVLIGLWVVNNLEVRFIDNEFIYLIIIALIVFSIFNFRKKAICFAGDVGSISAAFIILFLLATLILKTHNLLYLLFLSVYGTDSTLTIAYRLYLKENIFKPHRRHIYQLLANEKGYSHLFISAIYSSAQLLICFIVYSIIKSSSNTLSSYFLGLAMILLLTTLFLLARIWINRITV